MTIIISDTGPLNYLVQIRQVELLARLFEKILVPRQVFEELNQPSTPSEVKNWINSPPTWLELVDVAEELPS